jgi:hypothetical protein
MRLKLVLIASLLAAIIGAGSGIAIAYWSLGLWRSNFVYSFRGYGWLGVILLPPVLLSLLAGFFVYRHTARRRKLQAALTVILTVAISIAIYIAAVLIFLR